MANTKTVLLVDDDDALVNALLRKFEGLDFDVTVAKDGNDALRIMDEKVFDVIITDLHMPNKSGIDMLKERKGTKSADTPAYVITNLGSDHYCDEAKEAGAKACFVKSRITLSEVVDIIQRELA